tara:strand:- start:71 stop:589 length:519 start_codon:yes stop_codon:yes gene_type:complete
MNNFNVFKINNFSEHKNKLINLIEQSPCKNITDEDQKISFTDYSLENNIKEGKKYVKYFKENIFQLLALDLSKKFNCTVIHLRHIWFQLYKKGDFHSTHRHSNHFTNVFYINLPDKKLKTKIYDLNNKIIEVIVEEGDILTFPSYLMHESPVNFCDENKIIISFNIDIDHKI